jgi:hypothetical protein
MIQSLDDMPLWLRCSDVGNVIIRANTKDWCVTPCGAGPKHLGKQQHLAWIATHVYQTQRLMLAPHEMVLLDDDADNVRVAREFGHEAMAVRDDVSLAAIDAFARNLVVRRREPVHVIPDGHAGGGGGHAGAGHGGHGGHGHHGHHHGNHGHHGGAESS